MNYGKDYEHRYDDIIDMPHYTPRNHARMSVENRAAQFSPFAALTGYGDAVGEAERLTQERAELSEQELELLDEKLSEILSCIDEKPQIKIEYFVKDKKKNGGEYVTFTGKLKKADSCSGTLVFLDGTVVSIKDIYKMEVVK